QPAVHPLQVGGGEPAGTQSGLVGHDSDAEVRGTEPVQGRPGARHRSQRVRVAVVRHVGDQRSVTVEQDRVEQRGPHAGPVPPSPGTQTLLPRVYPGSPAGRGVARTSAGPSPVSSAARPGGNGGGRSPRDVPSGRQPATTPGASST